MKFRLVEASRRPQWPFWAILIVLLWIVLGCTAVFLGEYLDRPAQLCLFKRLIGIPCPTCGATRGSLAVLQGRIIEGWLYNPLLLSVFGICLLLLAVRLCFRRKLQLQLSRVERIIAWAFLAVLFAANWLYVILYVG